jgi:hypothetical protein
VTTTAIILASGIIRTLFWFAGAVLCYRQRRGILFAGFAGSAASSAVFTLTNAGLAAPFHLFNVAVFLGSPLAALFLASVFDRDRRLERAKGWQLW